MIPLGMRLSFNLAFRPMDTQLKDDITETLNQASSRTLDAVYEEVCETIERTERTLENARMQANLDLGVYATSELIGQVRKLSRRELSRNRDRIERKLQRLIGKVTTAEARTGSGCTKIHSGTYRKEPALDPPRRSRPHRQQRGRGGKSRKQTTTTTVFTPTEEDLRAFDPVILVDGFQPSQDQISVCRLPDCFAPTPKEPIDISDALIGSHNWAERLRWH